MGFWAVVVTLRGALGGKLSDRHLRLVRLYMEGGSPLPLWVGITWPSCEARDAGKKKVMADPRVQPDVNPMPFDGQRLIYGGFEPIVEM